MIHRVFVYGTLKAGFPNAHVNRGTRVPGTFVTVERWPLYIATEDHIPWLVARVGEGAHVVGELYEVDDAGLARMDALERIDDPLNWYQRQTIAVRDRDDPAAAPVSAFVYFGSAARLRAGPVHEGPLAEVLPEHARRYRADDHDARVG